MSRNLEIVDWTKKELDDRSARLFSKRVVWPAINSLYIQAYSEPFISDRNIDEEFFMEEELYSTVGYKSIVITLDAHCGDSESTLYRYTPVGTADITIEDRKLEAEDLFFNDETQLEIWRKKSFLFTTDEETDPVWVDITHILKDPMGKFARPTTEQQRNALRFMGKETDGDTLSHQDCLDIGNTLVLLGASERLVDTRMRRFERSLRRVA